MSEPTTRRLTEVLPEADVVRCASASEFLAADVEPGVVAFIDGVNLATLAVSSHAPAVVVAEEPLPQIITWLAGRSWLEHVVSASALEHPVAGEHLRNVVRSLVDGKPPRLLDWVERGLAGRRVKLAQASRRAERLEKMTELYESNGVSPRTIQMLRDAAEELLTNAFYDAPVAAGVVGEPISRTRDVTLPDEHACDLAYGAREDLAMVRVRDPFGSLARPRLVEVLSRCAAKGMHVEVDESMGGAGLGLWRIFSGASLVAISVIPGRSTEILVGMWKRAAGPRPSSFHLYFDAEQKQKHPRRWIVDKDSTITTAVTLVDKPSPR